MAIYYIYLVIFCLGSLLEKLNLKVGRTIFTLLVTLLIIFLGIRYQVGNDYKTYYDNYLGINFNTFYNSSVTTAKEPLYLLSNYIFSFEFLIFFYGFLSIFLLRKAIVFFSYPQFFVLTLLVYYGFYFIIFNVHLIRQGLAIAIVIYSYIYLYKKQYKIYVLLVLIAFLFHTSAIFCLPFGFFFKKNIKLKTQVIILIFSLIIAVNSVIFTTFFYSVGRNIPILSGYLDVYRVAEVTNYGISTGMILDICLLIFFMFNINKLSPKERFLYNIFFISVILSLLLIINPAALRLAYYFRITNIFLLPFLYKFVKLKMFPLLIVIALSATYLITSFSSVGEYGRGDRNLHFKTIFYKQ